MIKHLINQLEQQLQADATLSAKQKQDLLALLHELDRAILESKGSAHTQSALEKLQTEMQVLEVTHPQLVDMVNRICVMLASLGI